MTTDRTADELVGAGLDLLDAPPMARHRLAAAIPLAAAGRRLDVTVSDRGVIVIVSPARDDWSSMLTDRERDVAAAVARGLTNREIAEELFVSVATVKDHVHHILAKTELPNRAAVAGRWRANVHR